MDRLFSYLLASSWFFLLGWIVLLLVACVLVFGRDTP